MLLGKEILSYKQPMPVHYFKKSNKKPTSLQKKMLKLQCQNQISSNWVSYSSELSLAPWGDWWTWNKPCRYPTSKNPKNIRKKPLKSRKPARIQPKLYHKVPYKIKRRSTFCYRAVPSTHWANVHVKFNLKEANLVMNHAWFMLYSFYLASTDRNIANLFQIFGFITSTSCAINYGSTNCSG